MERSNFGIAKNKLVSGALLLTLSTILLKITGLIYKIPMLSILGAEGMGYFNSAYELYTLIVSAATAGLPVSLSVLLSDALAKGDAERARKIDRTALFLCFFAGTIGSLLLAFFAKTFARMIGSPGALYSILSICPTLFFSCISAAYRGSFQGRSKMAPTALSQLAEALLKLFFGLLFASLFQKNGMSVEKCAAGAGFGLSLGSALTCFGLALAKKRTSFIKGRPLAKRSGETSQILRDLARISLPITLGVTLTGATRILDMAMILRRLQSIGMDASAANRVYGGYTTLALSVFGLLPSLVNSISLPLVPLLSAAAATGDREREEELVHEGFRLIALFAIPGAIGITAFSEEILSFLFSGQTEAVSLAAPLLSCLGISSFLSCMIGGIQSILHARKIVIRPLLIMLFGALVKSVSAYVLIGNPNIAILGAPASTFLCNLFVTILGLSLVLKNGYREPRARVFFLPLLSSAGSIALVCLLFQPILRSVLSQKLLFVCELFLFAILYFGLSFLSGSLKKTDFLPGGLLHLQKSAKNAAK
ncbi:MAG: oligosaccharide flippase family protein [Clostridia bacterium]|nr:oligosaccharide flippase family protein [Clostridia bacterium]